MPVALAQPYYGFTDFFSGTERTLVMDAANGRQLTAGNSLVAWFAQGTNGNRDWACEDATHARAFTRIFLEHDSGYRFAFFYLDDIDGGDTDIRIYETGGLSSQIGCGVFEVEGLDNAVDSLEVFDTYEDTVKTTTHPCSLAGISSAGECFVMCGGISSASRGSAIAPAGFTSAADVGQRLFIGYRIEPSALASETATYGQTSGSKRTPQNAIAAFAAASGGGAGAELDGTAANTSLTTGALSTDITIAGQADVLATVAGALVTDMPITATAPCQAMTGGALTTDIVIAGVLASNALTDGDLVTTIQLAGAVDISAQTAGEFASDGDLFDGVAACTGTGVGALDTGVLLEGDAAAAAMAQGALSTTVVLTGTIAVAADAAGELDISTAFAGVAAATVESAGALDTAIWLTGIADARATLDGELSGGTGPELGKQTALERAAAHRALARVTDPHALARLTEPHAMVRI